MSAEELTSGLIHVWYATVTDLSPELPVLEGSLLNDENSRAGSYLFESDRQLFVVCRSLLRHLLAKYLGSSPREVTLGYGTFGKPFVSDASWLEFNASHSGDLVAFAFCRGRRVGIDIERIDEDEAVVEAANRVFSPDELAELRSLNGREKQRAFYHCWVLKEAYLKALGCGLSRAGTEFDVSTRPGDPPALQRVGWDPSEPPRWRLVDLDLSPGYAAALAVEGHDWSLRCRRITALSGLERG